MALVRPRLTDHFGLAVAQSSVPFAIPFLDEDLPLFVDPFLLWKSPSQQDHSLHESIVSAFNRLMNGFQQGKFANAPEILIELSECEEVGLGSSARRTGRRINSNTATQILRHPSQGDASRRIELQHIEEIQLYTEGISKDRISDFACNLMKSFLIDFTMEECERIGLPVTDVVLERQFDVRKLDFLNTKAKLPLHPETGKPILLIPKRWLRHTPWINFDGYFKHCIPNDDQHGRVVEDRVQLLRFNRENWGMVEAYIATMERSASDCKNDPLFTQIPIVSATRKLSQMRKLPSGKTANADRLYEEAATVLLSNLLYPQLDFATTQARTDSGAQIRDLVFYNNRNIDFLSDIERLFESRQLVFELKNVAKVEREHINQVHRYLGNEFGRFGVLVTRNPLPRAIRQNTIDLWSGKRIAIVPLYDTDIEQMVSLFDQKQRPPIDVLKRAYIDFMRDCPS